jgi:hypothetical protein
MTATLHISTPDGGIETLRLVTAAVEHEITRLEMSLHAADRRLEPFEQQYNISSEMFYTTMAAEDLHGGDEEYIRWAGEYELRERLSTRLEHLRGLQYEY